MGKKEEKIARTVLRTVGKNLKARARNWLNTGIEVLDILEEGEKE